MWRQPQIEKERLSGILGLLRRYIQKEECFICKLRQYLGMTKPGATRPPECSLDFRPPITEIVTNRSVGGAMGCRFWISNMEDVGDAGMPKK